MIFIWLNKAVFDCNGGKNGFPQQAPWLIFSVNALLQVLSASLYMLPAPASPPPFFRQSTKSHAAKLPITLFLQPPPPPPRKGRMNDAHCIDTKLFPRPPSLLMSNASSIDLLVDLKEIQSQMPQVAFFPLWEIKRFNSPCLSTLIIIISPSSPFVCLLRRLPLP